MKPTPPTIDHDPNEPHRKQAPAAEHFDPKEPIFGAGAWPFICTLVVGFLLMTFIVKPVGQLVCDKFNFCTTAERVARQADQSGR